MQGSCLCGAVQYELTEQVQSVGHCHCRMCQKSHGAAYGTYTPVQNEHFKVLKGEEDIQEYRSSSTVTRTFCRRCGSNLQFKRDGKSQFGLAVGTLEGLAEVESSFEIFTDERAAWGNTDSSVSYRGDHGI